MESRYNVVELLAERDRLEGEVVRHRSRNSLVKALVCALGVMGSVFAVDWVNNKMDEREYVKSHLMLEQIRAGEIKDNQDSRTLIPVYQVPVDEKLMEELRKLPPAPQILPYEPKIDRKGPLIQNFPNGRTAEKPSYLDSIR